MVDGVLLLVDAAEGPLPQTRYVLSKALARRPARRRRAQQGRPRTTPGPTRCSTRSSSCSSTSAPTPDQIDVPGHLRGRPRGPLGGRRRHAGPEDDLTPLLDAVLDTIPAPDGDPDAPLQAIVTNLDASDYLGRLAIGRVVQRHAAQGRARRAARRGGRRGPAAAQAPAHPAAWRSAASAGPRSTSSSPATSSSSPASPRSRSATPSPPRRPRAAARASRSTSRCCA